MEITELAPGDNQRKCVRIEVPDGLCVAVLSDGIAQVNAVCVDQSAEGFGLRFSSAVPWDVGQELLLNINDCWYDVRLVRCFEKDACTHVGLMRIRDCGDLGPARSLRLWAALRHLLKLHFACNVQVLGIVSAFLLCMVILLLALRPTAPLKASGEWLGDLLSGAKTDHSPVAPKQSAPISFSGRELAGGASKKKMARNRVADGLNNELSEQRIRTMLSRHKNVAWSEVEAVLGLTKQQSEKLLTLMRADSSEFSIDQIDTTKIVIANRQEFANFLETLPDQVFAFLSAEQQRQLQTMLHELKNGR